MKAGHGFSVGSCHANAPYRLDGLGPESVQTTVETPAYLPKSLPRTSQRLQTVTLGLKDEDPEE